VKVITLNIILNDEMVWASRDAKMERERERERVLASNQVSFSVSSALMKTDWGMIATSVIHE